MIWILNKAVSPFYILVYNWFWISIIKGLKVLLYDADESVAIHESFNII